MTYRGKIKNGAVVLDQPAALPDGVEVEVRPLIQGETIPTLYERWKDFIGIAEGLPSDSSTNHDHYLYGVPKQ
jgi:hypothetical protein